MSRHPPLKTTGPNEPVVTKTASTALTNEFNLGSLTTGILKHTVSGGVSTPATAARLTDYDLARDWVEARLDNAATYAGIDRAKMVYDHNGFQVASSRYTASAAATHTRDDGGYITQSLTANPGGNIQLYNEYFRVSSIITKKFMVATRSRFAIAGDATAEFWVCAVLGSTGNAVAGIYVLNGAAKLRKFNGAATDVAMTWVPDTATWHNFEFVFDGTTFRTYVDGVADATANTTGAANDFGHWFCWAKTGNAGSLQTNDAIMIQEAP